MSRFFPATADCGQHTLFGSVFARTYAGDHLQLSLVDLPADSHVDWHAHTNEQMGMIVSGRVHFWIGDEEKELGPGDFYLAPGGVRHRVVPIGGPAQVIDVFHPVRDEYR